MKNVPYSYSGKRERTEREELRNLESNRTQGEEENYKYLRKLKADAINLREEKKS